MEFNVKSLKELKDKLEGHKVKWEEYSAKDARKYKEHYLQDKKTVIKKIELIAEAKEKIDKYEKDIAEILSRLKKMGFEFIKEKEDKKDTRESQVLPEPDKPNFDNGGTSTPPDTFTGSSSIEEV